MASVINGELSRGQDVRSNNVLAVTALANILKPSLGPVGLDKMLVDEVGDVTITNDGATILKLIEVEHPAAKVMAELSDLQDQEVGDGTTSVVILAAELLKTGNELIKNGTHPTVVINGFNIAKKEGCRFIADMAQRVDALGPECVLNAARTSMASKNIGQNPEFWAKLAYDAVVATKTINASGATKYSVKSINILKAHGKSALESELVNGFALNCVLASPQMPKSVSKAKIALLDFDLRKTRLPLGVQVLCDNVRNLEDIRREEIEITKRRIQMLIAAGANVILTTKGIDDTMMKCFVESKVMGVRRCTKQDLKSIAKATGAQILLSLSDMDGNESVDASCLGEADLVEECKVGDGELIYIRQPKYTRAQTIILRGANDYFLDEIDRALHDVLMIVKRTLESKTVVPGGGCVETALSVYLEHMADTMGAREQLPLASFAQALLVIPKTLAVNGSYDSSELVSKLRAYHYASQTDEKRAEHKYMGLDLETGNVRNNLEAGVLEPALSKIKMLRFATEAAVTILRIDDSIKMTPAERPDRPSHDHY